MRLGMSALSVCLFFLAPLAHAAVLTVNPPTGTSNTITVTLDTQGESINAVDLHLTFDPNTFTIKDVSDGNSFIDLWVDAPTFSNTNGTLDLAGVTPGGINAGMGRVIAIDIIPRQGAMTSTFNVASASVLLNDGKGTAAKLTIVSKPFSIGSIVVSTSTAPVDTVAPNAFTPIIASDPNLFNGEYFLVFSATDEGSGIDHYEVLETPSSSIGNITNWQLATSPYLLKDQTLSSNIYVRAIDRSGNFRVVEIPAAVAHATSPVVSSRVVPGIAFGILIIVVAAVLLVVWVRKRYAR